MAVGSTGSYPSDVRLRLGRECPVLWILRRLFFLAFVGGIVFLFARSEWRDRKVAELERRLGALAATGPISAAALEREGLTVLSGRDANLTLFNLPYRGEKTRAMEKKARQAPETVVLQGGGVICLIYYRGVDNVDCILDGTSAPGRALHVQ
jgi:hypothetical protein